MTGVVSEQPEHADPTDRLLAEGGIGMGEVARRLGKGKGGRPTHPSTPARWATTGTLLPDGSRLRLESVSLPGGRLVTSWPAVRRFLSALQSQPKLAEAAPVRGPGDRLRASERADEELRAAGC